ncbi:MAG: nicotinamide-nucleotide amidase [Gammaproteobacteria bacterium]|nr:nicotinamide-nucleotide amidase [Gammaproteobacteria bacterium]
MEEIIRRISQQLISEDVMLVTAESCTGGWIAKTLTDVAGSSQWFDRGFITYSNVSKVEMLGVSMETLAQYGAVSEQIAAEMAMGALNNSQGGYGVSVTGIAGPDGGSPEKPVGTVCFGWAKKNGAVFSKTFLFAGDRERIRAQAVKCALLGLFDIF